MPSSMFSYSRWAEHHQIHSNTRWQRQSLLETQTRFFNLLSGIDGGIFGSTTLALFEAESSNTWTPNNLNIAVPWHKSKPLVLFLKTEGFERQNREATPYQWYHLINHHHCFTKAGIPPSLWPKAMTNPLYPSLSALAQLLLWTPSLVVPFTASTRRLLGDTGRWQIGLMSEMANLRNFENEDIRSLRARL